MTNLKTWPATEWLTFHTWPAPEGRIRLCRCWPLDWPLQQEHSSASWLAEHFTPLWSYTKKLLQLLPRFLEDSWLKHDIYMFSYVTDYSGQIYSSITSNICVVLVMIYTLKSLKHEIGTAKVCCARELMGSCAVQRAPDSEIFSTIHNIWNIHRRSSLCR